MLRLPRRLVCAQPISRVLSTQRTLPSINLPTVRFSRRYVSSGSSTRPPDRYSRLLASLRHGMKEDQLAITIAALLSSKSNSVKLRTLQDDLQPYVSRFNRDSLYKKVNHFLNNSPADNFDSVVAQSPDVTIERDGKGGAEEASNRRSAKHLTSDTETLDDPALPSPAEELSAHLQNFQVRRALELMEPEQLAELQDLLSRVYHETTGDEDMGVLDHIADLLSYHGVGIHYSRRVSPVREEPETNFLAEYESLIGEPLEVDVLDEKKSPASGSLEAEKQSDMALFRPTQPPIEKKHNPYPDLMTPDPLLDSRDVLDLPPSKESPYHNRVVIRNHSSIFNEALAQDGSFDLEDYVPTKTDETEESATSHGNLPFTSHELRNFYRFPLVTRRVTQQTGKGKIHRQFVLMVVGNGDGLVGYGIGKDEDATRASAKAFTQAVRNMDWVERFEKRTIWTEMETKLGATQLILRPRPVGFGLRCNPNLHQVLKAAGIKDISAKVWGSRNPIMVIQAAFRMLHAGHAPLAMGDGVGGMAKKLDKGSGPRSKGDVERERGRQLVSLRK